MSFFKHKALAGQLDTSRIPRHIAIIMDGNGRWATRRGLPRTAGHLQGVKALEKVVLGASELGIRYLTVFAFSTENWSRPSEEVNALFKMVIDFNNKGVKFLLKNNVKVKFLGDVNGLPEDIQASIVKVEAKTAGCDGMQFNIAFNYSGRADILQAVNKAVQNGRPVTEEEFERLLYTADIPAPDIILRTGGEKRISNFMLYQAAYSELIFSDKFWPDFNKKQLEKVIAEYATRDRRFGGLTSEEKC